MANCYEIIAMAKALGALCPSILRPESGGEHLSIDYLYLKLFSYDILIISFTLSINARKDEVSDDHKPISTVVKIISLEPLQLQLQQIPPKSTKSPRRVKQPASR